MARFLIDAERSRVWIDARSSLHPIHSESTGLEGFIDADLADSGGVDPARDVPGRLVRGRLTLPLRRLSSGNPLYDREMLRRVDARRHPSIVAELDGMVRVEAENGYLVRGR